MARGDWNRVSRRRPCPVCERPDWCLYAGDESAPSAVICARVESNKRVGDQGAGWLHVLRNDGPVWPEWKRTVHIAVRKLGPEPAGRKRVAIQAPDVKALKTGELTNHETASLPPGP
jgi:hypothetical protein